MRNFVFFGGSLLAGLASVAAAEPSSLHHLGRTRYPTGHSGTGKGAEPTINRWTGRPHEHRREIARRQRQAAAQA